LRQCDTEIRSAEFARFTSLWAALRRSRVHTAELIALN
jgi:hypothetical protein